MVHERRLNEGCPRSHGTHRLTSRNRTGRALLDADAAVHIRQLVTGVRIQVIRRAPVELVSRTDLPAHQQPQIRAQLSLVLEGIMCQSLLPKSDGKGRAMCMEIMVPNAAIRNLIREDKIHQIYSAMQSGQEKFGMQTFNQSLATAYFQKQITLETALLRSSNQDELQEMINRGAGLLNRTTAAGATLAKGASPTKR